MRRPKTIRWLIIIGLLLAVVLGGLYGFNRFREQAIATYFANNKPPPAQISAAEVKTEALPRFAPGIGSLAAVHQVTINPEVGGRVTKIFFEPGATVKAGDPLVQLNDAPERADLANYQAQARWAQPHCSGRMTLGAAPVRSRRNRRPEAEPARPGAGADRQDRGADRAKADPCAVCRPARHATDRGRAIPDPGRADRHPDRPVDALRQFHPAGAATLGNQGRPAGRCHRRRVPRPHLHCRNHDDRASGQRRYPDDVDPGDDEQSGRCAVARHVRRCRGGAAAAAGCDGASRRPRSITRSTATASM